MLVRRIILGVVLLGVAWLAYVGYKSWIARRAMMGGDVYSETVDSVPTTLKQSAAPASANQATGQPTPQSTSQPSAQPTVQAPSAPATAQASQPGKGSADPALTQTASAAPSDTRDSILPNPPNGAVFAGTGHYQVYRQGNITWRLDTETGHACVLFATQQEWKKPQVYRNGCGLNASR